MKFKLLLLRINVALFSIFSLSNIHAQEDGLVEEIVTANSIPRAATVDLSYFESAEVITSIGYLLENQEYFNFSEDELVKVTELKIAYLNLLSDWISHYRVALSENSSVQETYNWMTYIIATIVHLFLLLGFYAGWQEFRQSTRIREQANSQQEMQEFEVSLNSLAIRTSFLGLIILASSLLLYFAYLRSVFPLVQIGG